MTNRENFTYQELKDEDFNKYIYTEFLRKHPYMTKDQMILKLKNIIDNNSYKKTEYEKALNILSNDEKKNITIPIMYNDNENKNITTPIMYSDNENKNEKSSDIFENFNYWRNNVFENFIEDIDTDVSEMPSDSTKILNYLNGIDIQNTVFANIPNFNETRNILNINSITDIINDKNTEIKKFINYQDTLNEILSKYYNKLVDTSLSEENKLIVHKKITNITETLLDYTKLSYEEIIKSVNIEDLFPEMINNAKTVEEYDTAIKILTDSEKYVLEFMKNKNSKMVLLINSTNEDNDILSTTTGSNLKTIIIVVVIILIILLFFYLYKMKK